MKRIELPSVERLRELFTYDKETGELVWKVRNSRRIRVGHIAGSLNPDGYVRIRIDGISYQAHRLVWKHVTGNEPPTQLDHKDLDKTNNRIENLRPATYGLNGANQRVRRDSGTGFKGVRELDGRFYGRIAVGGVSESLGGYSTPEEAHAAYCTAAATHYGEYFCAG